MTENNNENSNYSYTQNLISSEKINEFLSNEGKVIRTFLISSIITIVFCTILYFNYILLGEFFTTLFLSFISSLALRPSKDKIIYKLKKHFRQSHKHFVLRSWIFKILRFFQIIWLFNFICSKIWKKKTILKMNSDSYDHPQDSDISEDEKSKLNVFNSLNYLLFICFFYIMIFKLKIFISVTIVFIYFLVDFLVRLFIDILIILSRKFSNNTLVLDSNGVPRDYVHSIVSSLLIIYYLMIMIFIIIFGIGLFYLDLKKIYIYLNENNDFLKIIKENLLGSDKFKIYQKTIFEQFNLMEVYLNSTYISIDTQFPQTSFIQSGNYTVYDLSNKILNVLNDPTFVIEGYAPGNPNNTILFKKNCEEYENTIIIILRKIFQSEYIERFHCGSRILLKQLNIDIENFISGNFIIYIKRFLGIIKVLFDLLASTIFYNLIQFSMDIVNLAFLNVLFITCLYYLLKWEGNFIKETLKILPVNDKNLDIIAKEFYKSLEGIFMSTLEIFISHTLITWLLFDIFKIDLLYIFAFISGLISLFPVLSPYLILLPATVILIIRETWSYVNYLKILTLNVSYIILIVNVDNAIYNKNFSTHPYITGLSFVMGMYAFGFKGIIYGPLLLCFSLLISRVFSNIMYKKPE